MKSSGELFMSNQPMRTMKLQLLWEACQDLLGNVVPEGDEITAANPLIIIDCQIACGTSITRRLEVNEIAPETKEFFVNVVLRHHPIFGYKVSLPTLKNLLRPLDATVLEDARVRATLSSALADLVTEAETASPGTTTQREAGWLALELLESE